MSGTARRLADTLQTTLPEARTFAGCPTDGELASLPNVAAVYLLQDGGGRPVQLATTQQLRRLTVARLAADDDGASSRRADLAAITRGIRWREVHSRFEADLWYYRLTRQLQPDDYLKRVSFRAATFLHFDPAAPIPELRLETRVYQRRGEFLGPFPTRTQAQAALEGLWDLFDLCRYPEQIRKLPHGQRCAYADMGRCDAPCDGSAPPENYRVRHAAAWRFAQGAVGEWRCGAGQRMREQAAHLEFERAALTKTQLEFARRWERDWSPHVVVADQLRRVLLVPVVRHKAWKAFCFDRGRIESGRMIRDRAFATEVEPAIAAAFAAVENRDAVDATARMEQTWLLAHFLHHKQAEAALIEPVRGADSAQTVAERLIAAQARRAAARTANAGADESRGAG